MPSPPQIAKSTGNGRSIGGSRDPGGGIPEQNPNALTGGAPAGVTFGADLPVNASSGTNFTTGGYTPSSERG